MPSCLLLYNNVMFSSFVFFVMLIRCYATILLCYNVTTYNVTMLLILYCYYSDSERDRKLCFNLNTDLEMIDHYNIITGAVPTLKTI